MPDGRRKRRYSQNASKRTWYATYRSWRFARRLGVGKPDGAITPLAGIMHQSVLRLCQP